MSRIHAALARATNGQAPILPSDVETPTGAASGSVQPAFVAPWTIDAGDVDAAARPTEAGGAAPSLDASTGSVIFASSAVATRRPFPEDIGEKLVTADVSEEQTTLAAAIEQYRKLAATLHRAQHERGLKLIMVTSARPGEGKSLTAANLALTLSESYQRRVLLIDADLRQPSLHEILGVPNATGLSDGLSAGAGARIPLLEVSSYLSFLSSGRPMSDPTAGLTSERMRRVLDAARQRFDWTIIDTPPVGLLTDAKLLAEMVDGVLMVTDAGSNAYPELQRTVADVGRERVLGVVLNRLEQAPGGSYYYRHGYRYPRSGQGRGTGDDHG